MLMKRILPILVVEDDELVRIVIHDCLTDAGFDVQTASDGAQAQACIRDGPGFSALITDIRLGDGPSGWEVAGLARRLNPHLPVAYVTGDSCADWPRLGVPDSVLFSKPCSPGQVVDAVGRLIGSSHS